MNGGVTPRDCPAVLLTLVTRLALARCVGKTVVKSVVPSPTTGVVMQQQALKVGNVSSTLPRNCSRVKEPIVISTSIAQPPAISPSDYLAIDRMLSDEALTIRDTVRSFVRSRVLHFVGD